MAWTSWMAAALVLTLVALGALLAAEAMGSRTGVAIAKPLASTGFIVLAVTSGAAEVSSGQLILAGLALSWWGDVLLIPKGKPWFLSGLVAFLLGHIAYVAAFAARGLDGVTSVIALAALAVPGVLVFRVLRPHLGSMKGPVIAYIIVISAMVAAAVGSYLRLGGGLLLGGAILFYLSDLCVARDRFLRPGLVNRAIGLPVYYAGQILLALGAAS